MSVSVEELLGKMYSSMGHDGIRSEYELILKIMQNLSNPLAEPMST